MTVNFARVPINELKPYEIRDIFLLARDKKFPALKRLLDLTQMKSRHNLDYGDQTPELYRNQGISQLLIELNEIFNNAELSS